jgi:ABC-type bacteriocin/lantibiotic exporter with double-glycine peptidase domain
VLLKQPTLLFLDEATASLDTETEELFQNVLETNFPNSTIVCIAHRTETLKWCKTRIEMRQGKILRMSDVDLDSK